MTKGHTPEESSEPRISEGQHFTQNSLQTVWRRKRIDSAVVGHTIPVSGSFLEETRVRHAPAMTVIEISSGSCVDEPVTTLDTAELGVLEYVITPAFVDNFISGEDLTGLHQLRTPCVEVSISVQFVLPRDAQPRKRNDENSKIDQGAWLDCLPTRIPERDSATH